jgi:hypothetical protein
MKIRNTLARRERRGRRGSAVLLSIIATLVLAAMAAAMLAVSGGLQRENEGATKKLRALYAAEAGLAENITNVRAGIVADIGGDNAPMTFGQDGYWSTAVDNGDDTLTVQAFGTAENQVCGVEAILVRQDDGPFASALFAGNTSGDPLYDMKFGGKGKHADDINGKVYSGGNVRVTGQADIDGAIRALGVITGATGEEGKGAPIPDIPGMNYAVNHDVDVAGEFAHGGAKYKTHDGLGGKAWQLPEENLAHIFRRNPSDRATDTVTTAKDDYFLEDPYETPQPGSTISAASGTHITITGMPGKPGPNGNDLVYYIDGNLWLHNKNLFTFTMFNTGGDGVRVTFVVRGNIYFSDNLFYHHDKKDGVAFIAIADEDVSDSGNIYFGDPTYGTLKNMEAFMYAENNFYDNNLSATGSAAVRVYGNMTAGNQVAINRDFGNQHSKLTVDFDERLVERELNLPGIPRSSGAAPLWLVASWRPISAP